MFRHYRFIKPRVYVDLKALKQNHLQRNQEGVEGGGGKREGKGGEGSGVQGKIGSKLILYVHENGLV